MKNSIGFLVICFVVVSPQTLPQEEAECECPTCEIGQLTFRHFDNFTEPNWKTLERSAWEKDIWKYPDDGEWYRDSQSKKFYYRSGSTIYLETSNSRYSKWVTNDGMNYTRSDSYLWTFDSNGGWHRLENRQTPTCECDRNCRCNGVCNCPNGCDNQDGFPIPHSIIQCRCQIRIPSKGTWYTIDGNPEYVEGNTKYRKVPNGCFLKYMGKIAIPGIWDWHRRTGEWMKVDEECCLSNSCGTRPNMNIHGTDDGSEYQQNPRSG